MKRIAIVTGASGGLGREFVRLLPAGELDEVWCVARNQQKLEELKADWGNKIVPLPFDLSEQDSFVQIRGLLEQQQAVVSWLVNNAGVGEKLGSYQDFTLDQISNLVAVNCTSVASLCTVCLPHMTRGSRILNIASQSAFQPVPYLNLYASSKAFVRHYTRALNVELHGTGISATAVCPGWVDTDMLVREINGRKVTYPGLASAKDVAARALADAEKRRDSSVYSLYVRYMHLLAKVFPQRAVMKGWVRSLKGYR